MKYLHWKRILAPKPNETSEPDDQPAESTPPAELWQEIDETNLDNLDEFAELFSRQTESSIKARTIAKPIKVKRVVKVLDGKRSQSVGIFVGSLHVDFKTIEHAIYHCDTSSVSIETLQQLLEKKATPEELEEIKSAAAAQSDLPLDVPEKFLLRISNISCFPERISCIIFQTEFDDACKSISRKTKKAISICKFIIGNEYLKSLFSIILTLGNYMNGGHRTLGQADGFGLDILGQLRGIRSKDSKVSLLHFIIRTYIGKYRQNNVPLNEIKYPVPDVIDINQMLSIDFAELNEQVNQLQRKLKGN